MTLACPASANSHSFSLSLSLSLSLKSKRHDREFDPQIWLIKCPPQRVLYPKSTLPFHRFPFSFFLVSLSHKKPFPNFPTNFSGTDLLQLPITLQLRKPIVQIHQNVLTSPLPTINTQSSSLNIRL